MKILLLGAYGLIGSAIARLALERGHEVTGFGRDVRLGQRLLPALHWQRGDLGQMLKPEDWLGLVGGCDVVINAAGALQDGPGAKLVDVQDRSIRAALAASQATGVARFIQISAPGAHASSDTAFYATKAAADQAVRAASLDGYVLRPGLVLAPAAYGGTALLRMLAAIPLVQPMILGQSAIQTVALSDVAKAVLLAAEGQVPPGDYDLVEQKAHRLQDLVLALRGWLGFGEKVPVWRLPDGLAPFIGRLADVTGFFGWRSPLRSNAIKTLQSGIKGDSTPWTQAGGNAMMTLSQTLTQMPSTLQERVFARWALLMPLSILGLSAFWLASGIIGFVRFEAATSVLPADWPSWLKGLAVGLGGVGDIALGALVLFKRWARWACLGMIGLSLSYLAMASLLVPSLWLDPLGPLVKVLLATLLALLVAAMLEER